MPNNSADELNKPSEPKPSEPKPVEPNPSEPKPVEPKPNEPSICIPRAFKSITRKEIYDVVERLDLGAVERIDMVAKVNPRGECYNKVFIHFKVWNKKSEVAKNTRAQLLRGEEVKIVYSEPWFWKCTTSRVEKPTFRDYSAPPPRIDLGGCASLSAAKDAINEANEANATIATIKTEEP
jgi:signal recognition particle subunit SEC65